MTEEETPKQKAERLGVPLRTTPPFFKEPTPNPFVRQQNIYEEMVKQMLCTTVSVCETCGKELTRFQERPCGRTLCPFGELTM